jgi:hypothetical protein
MKETGGSKRSLYFSPKTTYLKHGHIFQKRSVCVQFWLFMSVEYTFLTLGRGVEDQQQPRCLSHRHYVQTFETYTLRPPLPFPYGLFGEGV